MLLPLKIKKNQKKPPVSNPFPFGTEENVSNCTIIIGKKISGATFLIVVDERPNGVQVPYIMEVMKKKKEKIRCVN